MTTEYIETQTKDGSIIRIEVEDGSKGKTGFGAQVSETDAAKKIAKNAYEETLNTIRACANGMVDTLQGMAAPPNTASIEFALKIDAQAGPMIAESGSNTHFKVSLSWKQPEPEKEEA
ncbi:MAG: hypothetical protein JXM69_03700 [Anaerolineae bacterium]|nr:hypothetical protein [Anaerolineae bacterium]